MRIFVFLAMFLVFGCSSKSPSVSLTETAKESISAIEKTLPKECLTESVKSQLSVLSKVVDTQLSVCDAEKDKLKAQKRSSDMLAFAMTVILLGLIGLKLYKKF